MRGIGGNAQAVIQTRTTERNEIGEAVEKWADAQTITGWLDYQSGDSRYQNYGAKTQESTHVFVADYVPLDKSIKAGNSRLIVNGATYDALLYDDPMGLNCQWEIYLRAVEQ